MFELWRCNVVVCQAHSESSGVGWSAVGQLTEAHYSTEACNFDFILTMQDMWQAARERSMQHRAAKAAAASAAAAASENSADEEEVHHVVKPFASIGDSQATADDSQLFEEAATGEAQPAVERKTYGCLRCKVCFMRFA